jgi:hypothetical protein
MMCFLGLTIRDAVSLECFSDVPNMIWDVKLEMIYCAFDIQRLLILLNLAILRVDGAWGHLGYSHRSNPIASTYVQDAQEPDSASFATITKVSEWIDRSFQLL